MGLVVAVGELSGGFLGPLVGGALADRFSLEAPLLIQGAIALLAGVVAFAMVETNPQVLARRAQGAPA
jgi:MFS family permease